MREKVFMAALIIMMGAIPVTAQKIAGRGTKAVTLCDIIAAPEKYVGRETRFVAVFESGGFGGHALLSHPSCQGVVVQPSIETGKKKSNLWKRISRNLKGDRSGISSSSGKFIFMGILTKAAAPGHTPIKGVLQDYFMKLVSAEVR